jgi:cell division protein FtsL
MGDWLKNNPIGSQLINLAITLLLVIFGIIYMHMVYFSIAKETNKIIINIEKHTVPDSLRYFNHE